MATETTERLVKDIKVLAADTQELIRQTAGESGERLAAARERAGQTLADLQTTLKDLQENAVERTRDAAKAANTYVYQNPWPVVAGVAAIAIIGGVLLARR